MVVKESAAEEARVYCKRARSGRYPTEREQRRNSEIRRKCPRREDFAGCEEKQFQEFSIYARPQRGRNTVANARGAEVSDRARTTQKFGNSQKMPPAGVELATFSLGRSYSIQLSYGGVFIFYQVYTALPTF